MAVDAKATTTNDTEITNTVDKVKATLQNHTLRMKQGNIVLINQVPFSPDMFKMCEEMELTEVALVYAYNDNNKPITDKIEAIKYTCVDGKNWYVFKVPNQTKPVISQEEIDRRDSENNPVFVKIPLEKIIFKPYQNPSDRGILRISLQIPFIEVL